MDALDGSFDFFFIKSARFIKIIIFHLIVMDSHLIRILDDGGFGGFKYRVNLNLIEILFFFIKFPFN